MANKAEGQKVYPVNINYLAEKCRMIEASGSDFTFKSENPSDNGVWFRIHHGLSMKSYGEKITITLTSIPEGTHVHILSQCGMPTQLFDMGKNKSNVDQLFQYLERGLQPAPPQAGPMPAKTPPAPPHVPAPPQFVFCNQCGKKHPVTARFCNACGNPLSGLPSK